MSPAASIAPALADAILLLRDPPLRQRMENAARIRIRNPFSVATVAEPLCETYEQVGLAS
jgi:hypothetical protein